MPVFEHVSRYPHPRAEVFAWHRRPGAFARLSPPGMAELVSGPTNGILTGSEIVLRLSHPLLAGLAGMVWRGKAPGVTWRVRHADFVENELFVDEQVSGPFKRWRHEHRFTDGPGGSTVVTDHVEWEVPVNVPGGIDRALVEMQLDGLFTFRERQLRDDLDLHARLGAAPAHVVISGGTGLIGRQLLALLTSGGHRVTRLVRGEPNGPNQLRWDPAAVLPADALEGVDAVVHLAGHSIAGRFNDHNKRLIRESRLTSTSSLAAALARPGAPRTLVQASGIGYYGARRPGELLTEESAPGDDFLATVVRDWEAAARPAVDAGVRTTFLRTGIVLSEGGGALLPQVPLFSIGLGGRLTRPDAWMSWIGLDDMARAYVHALFTPACEGPVNAVAPRPVTAGEFAQTLGRVLHRPAVVPTPAFGPKLLLGREGADQIIDTDQRVSSSKLAGTGFMFAQGTLADALRHALMR